VAHFRGITALVAHVRKHPAYFIQHGFLASWGFIQQVKMLGYGVKHTSSLRGSYILAQGSFALRWPTSWLATVLGWQKWNFSPAKLNLALHYIIEICLVDPLLLDMCCGAVHTSFSVPTHFCLYLTNHARMHKH